MTPTPTSPKLPFTRDSHQEDQQIVEALQLIRDAIDPALYFNIDRSHQVTSIRSLRRKAQSMFQPQDLEQFFVGPFHLNRTPDIDVYFTIIFDYIAPQSSTAQFIAQDNDDWVFLHISHLPLADGNEIPLPTGAIYFNLNFDDYLS